MENKEILSHIDYTQLKPYATWRDIQTLCNEAITYGTASVCIPPCFVERVKDKYDDQLKICTVIGFPLGYQSTAVKVFETADAVKYGADEIDMVINIGDAKAGAFDRITAEIRAVKEACRFSKLKVIIETCYLSEAEKTALCQCVTMAGADYIKTSTGFGTAGAELADIALFREHIGSEVKIKAAGGIRSKKAMEAFLEAGCQRIGASSIGELTSADC